MQVVGGKSALGLIPFGLLTSWGREREREREEAETQTELENSRILFLQLLLMVEKKQGL